MAKEITELLYEFNTRADITIESLADLISDIAEPVVRCKDCRWWGTKWKMKAPLVEYGDCLHLKDTSVKSDFFCAWGERREDG